MRRLWPQTLRGQLVLILVGGMLAAQALTGTIWYDVRRGQLQEVPIRLVGARVVDLLALLDAERGDLTRIAALRRPGFDFWLVPAPQSEDLIPDAGKINAARLLSGIVNTGLGRQVDMRLLSLHLRDQQDDEAGLSSMFDGESPKSHFLLDVALPDGRWLRVQASEDPGWKTSQPLALLLDYLGRIYVLRILGLVVIALVAVRLVTRPLDRLAQAAEALGRDIQRPPLVVQGPLEVRRAAQAFNAMQQRLVSNLAERTRFLAAVSHDLRSPITRLRLRTEMLAEAGLRDKFRRDLEHMEAMVSATLGFVQNEAATEHMQSVDIDALLASLQSDMQDMGHIVEVHGRANGPLPAYPRTLKRCLQNLLDNAIRYGGSASMQVEDTPEQVCVIVSDRGPGLPEAMLQQVFEPFFRLEASRNADTGGYGLGLSIAQTVARAHGGDLVLRNRPGGGLDAVLRLPRPAGTAAAI
ncbi:HAMP domain-containing protein [Pigmentiphaga aceris]|uniref:histidine kinase n=1 Tax=Pigmentiphaga aceris TaxID=1940612 RepID=A0A5C0B0B0_9BURK|nr:ATP-binding protein [Pigmentiphaga aceris]QEI08152.1 HAMP domain-containing protein [Pigmentiphaga aceris]